MAAEQYIRRAVCPLAVCPLVLMGLVALAGAADSTQPAVDPQLLKTLQAIDAKVARVKSLTTDFEQRKYSLLLKRPIVSKGTIVTLGSAMLWDTQSPEPTRMRIDAASMQIYYVKEKKIEAYPLKGKLAAMAANPLPRLDDLLQQFDVTQATPTPPVDSPLDLLLLPKQDELKQYVKEVRVGIEPASGLIDTFDITDPDGDRTVLHFTNQKINADLPEHALELNAPPGTPIVQPLGPGQ